MYMKLAKSFSLALELQHRLIHGVFCLDAWFLVIICTIVFFFPFFNQRPFPSRHHPFLTKMHLAFSVVTVSLQFAL